jgi:DNA-binding GntR family transcriptional regulator
MHILTEKIVDRESLQKLYVQMYSIIKEKIEKREWTNGAQIPTEDELCRAYDVSKATVRMAVTELARSGYLKKQQGKGTFVIYAQQDPGVTMKTKLTEDMFGEGVNTKKEVLSRGLKEPTEEMKSVLKVSASNDDENAALYYFLCKRVVNGETAYLEESYVPPAMLPTIEHEDICRKPLYDLIQEKGARKIYKVVQTIEIAEARSDIASLLHIPEGSPALLLHRLLIGSDSRPIAYTRLLGIGKKYKILTEFERMN